MPLRLPVHSFWGLLSLSLGCAATGGADGDNAGRALKGAPEAAASAIPAALAPRSGPRRLTATELDNALRDLLGDSAGNSSQSLPEDRRTPFDNDYTIQEPSASLVAGLELLARDRVRALVADRARRDRVVGCARGATPSDTCLRSFIAAFGRRALRRPLTQPEIARYLALAERAQRRGDFDAAVSSVLLALLQHPEFLYRVEMGTPIVGHPGLYRLNAFELATRLAFFLWGTIPDDRLLDDAAAGRLDDAAGVRAAARRLLDDPRARAKVERFFAQWLAFETLGVEGDLGRAMKAETRALLRRVIFEERRPWQDLFRMQETFVDDVLAKHYGLPSPGRRPAWIPYGETGRKGLLSHGAFLAGNGSKGDDTSPTMRGLAIRERLFCMTIPPPPPNVAAAEPPPATAEAPCKEDRYSSHRDVGCARCHKLMDPVGFGLERFDAQGRYRTVEPGKPSCAISGVGELAGVGEFSGPAGLSELLLATGELAGCMVRQVYRQAVGRSELDEIDDRAVARLAGSLGPRTADVRFDELVLALVSSEAFRHRRHEGFEER